MSKGKILAIAAVTLLLITHSAWAQRFDRGYDLSKTVPFVEKGSWMFGGTANYALHSMDNYSFLIVDNINSDGYVLSASPAFCYMFKDNMGIGMRMEYDRTMLKLDSADLRVADTGLSIRDYHYLTHKLTTKVILRNYIPLGNSKRFAMVNEAQLSLGFGQGKVIDGHNHDNQLGTYERVSSIGINVCPGMMAFASDHFAVEFYVNMLGLNLSHTEQIHNQVAEGSRNNMSVNFKINVLSVGFGIYYYL